MLLFLSMAQPQDGLYRAWALVREGKAAEAKVVCEEVLRQNPDAPGGRDLLEDINLWLAATKGGGTAKSIQGYLLQSRELVFEKEAVSLLPELQARDAFEEALKVDKVRQYEKFLADFPGSSYENEAKNHLAMAMADGFGKKATAADKNKAMFYAIDEATREYVDYAYASATGTLDPSVTYRTDPGKVYAANKERKKVKLAVGITAHGIIGSHGGTSFFVGKNPDYLAGGGVSLRINDISQPINYVFSAQALWHYSKYTLWPYKTEGWSGVVFIDFNWNFIRRDKIAVFLTAGLMDEMIPVWVQEFRGGVGLGWKHGEWRTGVTFLQQSNSHSNYMFSPAIGTSLTYYF